jgi:hypothetical protein
MHSDPMTEKENGSFFEPFFFYVMDQRRECWTLNAEPLFGAFVLFATANHLA